MKKPTAIYHTARGLLAHTKSKSQQAGAGSLLLDIGVTFPREELGRLGGDAGAT